MTQIDTDTKTLIEGITALDTQVVIKTDEDLKFAVTMLSSVKSNAKELKVKKNLAIYPLKESIKEINSWFKPAEDHLAGIEDSIKTVMLEYHNAVEEKARKATERIERKLDDGSMSVEKGITKLAGIDQADSNIQTANGGVQFRQSAEKVRITDVNELIGMRPSLLLRERVLEALRMEVLADVKAGVKCPGGAEVYRDKVVAGTSV